MEVTITDGGAQDHFELPEESTLVVAAAVAVGPIEFGSAQHLISEAERLIQDEALSPDKKKSKARVRNILNNINRTLEIVGQVANLFPPAKLAVEVLKGLLKLEIDRRDNSEQIVIMFHSMLTMMFMLRHLDGVTINEDDDLAHHLEQLLTIISKSMEEFVRFFKSGDFKLKMHMFNDQFNKYRQQLQDILVTRSEVRSKEMSLNLERIKANTEAIIARLGQPANDQEKKAIAIVQECGRDLVLHDKAKLEEVSSLVGGGRVTGNTQALLDANLDELLVSNMQQFHWKLESSMSQMNDSLNRAKEAILKKLDSGPYELIDDPDVKAVWKELSNHYEEKFRNEATKNDGTPPKDQWTLSIFSKVMYHPAIGDAIDEDGSGFISLYEVNSWLSQRPPSWSVPEWLVYWAVGWRMGNVKYTNMILEQLDEITEMCTVFSDKHADSENFRHHIGVYSQKIKIMKSIASWAATVQADDSSATQELTHEGETRLQELIDQSSKDQMAMISERLEILKYVLDDPADLPVLLGGTEIRVELVFLSIAYLILGNHVETMTRPDEISDGDWEIMAETLDMLTDVFHERMQELIRGWRNQKLHVELHITCFAGGIYAGWYTAFNDPKGEMKRILEKTPLDEAEEGTQSNSVVLAEASSPSIQRLNDKVGQLDTRIDLIMSMLQTLLEAQHGKLRYEVFSLDMHEVLETHMVDP
ncbi:hypothetical protein FRC17_008919, partial [Serendipita sp. 399]